MKKMILILTVLVLLLSLAACGREPGAVTEEPTPEPTPEQTEDPTPGTDELQYQAPRAGYYVASSVGVDGNVSFFTTMDPANGYIRLEADGTGAMLFDGVERTLTWDAENIYWGDITAPCMYTSYYDEELQMEDAMLMVLFMDSRTSVVFRPAEESEAAP